MSIGVKPVSILFKKGLNGITGLNYDLAELRSNGVGKSTIMDATFYALYGETIRNIKTSGIKNYVTNKGGLVELDFSVNDTNYRIERTVAPHTIKFYENGEEKTKSTLAENNKHIFDIINCSTDLAKNSIFTSINDTIPFMAQDAKLKRKFSEGILNISFISEILKSLREEYNLIQKEYDKKFAELEAAKNNLKNYEEEIVLWTNNRNSELKKIEESIAAFESKIEADKAKLSQIDEDTETKKHSDILLKIENVEKQLEKRRNDAQYEYDTSNANIGKLQVAANSYKPKNDLASINLQIEKLTKSLEEYPVNETVEDSQKILDEYTKYFNSHREVHERNINALNQEVTNLTVEYRSNKNDILKYEDEIKRLASLSGTCPTCLHSLEGSDADHINIHIDDLNKKIDKLNCSDIEKKIKECMAEISNQKSLIKKLDDDKKTKEDEFKAKEANRRAVAKINSEINTYKTQISNDEARTKIYENYLSQLEEEKASFKKNGEALDKLKPVWEEFLTKKNKAKENYNSFISNLEHNKTINGNIKSYNINIEQLKSRKTAKESEECRFIALKTKVTNEIEILSKKIEELDIELKAGEILKGVFSEEGAKTYITKKIIDILNRRIAYYIQKYQFKIKIVLDEFFEDKIFNQKGEECSYFNFSGAERKSIDLAILFAFIDLRKIQGDVNINTLFFDEILDSSMDKTGIQITLDILKERVDNYGEAIYVISHRKESLSNFDGEIIELEKRNGITTRK